MNRKKFKVTCNGRTYALFHDTKHATEYCTWKSLHSENTWTVEMGGRIMSYKNGKFSMG